MLYPNNPLLSSLFTSQTCNPFDGRLTRLVSQKLHPDPIINPVKICLLLIESSACSVLSQVTNFYRPIVSLYTTMTVATNASVGAKRKYFRGEYT